MRYYKQSHALPGIYLIALAFGAVCLVLAFIWDDAMARLQIFVCGIFGLAAGWMLRRGRVHYLEIDRQWIVHNGFKRWRLKKADVTRIEHGRKGFTEEYDPYLKVHAMGREYDVDDGFLLNEERIEDLARTMQAI